MMKMAPGAKALSGRVLEQDPGDPRSKVSMATKIEIASREKSFVLRISSAGIKIGPKGALGVVPVA